MITYREITLAEIHRHILEVDVSEHGDLIYLWQDGALITKPLVWDRPPRTAETWQGNWANVLPLPGVKAWGAFEGDVMAGHHRLPPAPDRGYGPTGRALCGQKPSPTGHRHAFDPIIGTTSHCRWTWTAVCLRHRIPVSGWFLSEPGFHSHPGCPPGAVCTGTG